MIGQLIDRLRRFGRTVYRLFTHSKWWTAVGHALQSTAATVLFFYIFGAGACTLPAVFWFGGRESSDAQKKIEQGEGKGAAVLDGVLDWIPGAIVPAVGVDIAHRLMPDFWATALSVAAIGLAIGLAWLLRPERRKES